MRDLISEIEVAEFRIPRTDAINKTSEFFFFFSDVEDRNKLG